MVYKFLMLYYYIKLIFLKDIHKNRIKPNEKFGLGFKDFETENTPTYNIPSVNCLIEVNIILTMTFLLLNKSIES